MSSSCRECQIWQTENPHRRLDDAKRQISTGSLEHVDGATLAQLLTRSRTLSITATAELGVEITDALVAARAAGVVHRDVKLGNIMISAHGLGCLRPPPRLGIGGFTNRLESSLCGTPRYMAPEQCLGADEDQSVDAYALGCTLFALLCGRPPFVGAPSEVIASHVRESAMPPSHFNPCIPEQLEQLILRMMAKNPAVRPTMEQIARELRQLAG